MIRAALLSTALVLAVPAAAQESPQAAPAADSGNFDLAQEKEKILDCAGEKFVFAWGAGAHPTKVTLCSEKDATTEEVIRMIDEAATKIERATGIPEDRRDAIVGQMRAKIAQLGGEKPTASTAPVTEVPEPAPVAPALVQTAPAETAPVVAAPIASVPAPVRAPALAKPRLSFECMTPGEFAGGGPCVTLGRDTILTVKAGAALAGGTSIQFVRNGEARAEVALGSMRKGQSLRIALPRQVCTGVSSAEVEIRVTSAGRVADTVGPYLLRC